MNFHEEVGNGKPSIQEREEAAADSTGHQ